MLRWSAATVVDACHMALPSSCGQSASRDKIQRRVSNINPTVELDTSRSTTRPSCHCSDPGSHTSSRSVPRSPLGFPCAPSLTLRSAAGQRGSGAIRTVREKQEASLRATHATCDWQVAARSETVLLLVAQHQAGAADRRPPRNVKQAQSHQGRRTTLAVDEQAQTCPVLLAPSIVRARDATPSFYPSRPLDGARVGVRRLRSSRAWRVAGGSRASPRRPRHHAASPPRQRTFSPSLPSPPRSPAPPTPPESDSHAARQANSTELLASRACTPWAFREVLACQI